MILEKECRMCGNSWQLEVDGYDYDAWRYQGVLVQDAFPYLTVDERELIISSTCGQCWDNMFPPEEGQLTEADLMAEEFEAGIWD
jgi:hypothetical protein